MPLKVGEEVGIDCEQPAFNQGSQDQGDRAATEVKPAPSALGCSLLMSSAKDPTRGLGQTQG